MPTAHKVLVKAGESALGCNSADTTATTSSATELDSSLKAEEGTHANSNNMEVEHELPGEDDVFGYVKIYGETTSVRYELQQLKIFYETYGKSPTLNTNSRLYKLCSRLRQIRRDPKATFIIGNKKPGEKLSDEIVSVLDSFNFQWELVSHKPKQYPNTLQGRIRELKDCQEKYGPSLNGMKKKGKGTILRFCRDIRMSQKNPDKPKYQLSENDIAELNSFGFKWELSGKQKIKSSSSVKSQSIVSSEVKLPTQTRSGRTIKRKSAVALSVDPSTKRYKIDGDGEEWTEVSYY